MKLASAKTFILVGIMAFTTSSCLQFWQLTRGKTDFDQNFRLDIPGCSTTFTINLKYENIEMIYITNGDVGFPKDYRFNGKLKLQFFDKGKLLQEREIGQWGPTRGKIGSVQYYWRRIILDDINLPQTDEYKRELSIKITVIRPDDAVSFERKTRIGIALWYE